jgi:hypothetical protein
MAQNFSKKKPAASVFPEFFYAGYEDKSLLLLLVVVVVVITARSQGSGCTAAIRLIAHPVF